MRLAELYLAGWAQATHRTSGELLTRAVLVVVVRLCPVIHDGDDLGEGVLHGAQLPMAGRAHQRTECLALESLRLQAKIHNGLLGGEIDTLLQAAEQRAYQRAETLLTQLLAATSDSPATATDFPTASL